MTKKATAAKAMATPAKPKTKEELKKLIKGKPAHATMNWDDAAGALFKPEEISAAKAEARAFAAEMELKELRKFAGKTQVQVSAAANMAQGAVSVVEKRDDHLLSTLRNYVRALGGELEVVARFGDKSIRLKRV